MSGLTNSEIERITYTQTSIGKNYFYLDQLLDSISPPASLKSPEPDKMQLGRLSRMPKEILLMILESLAIIDLMRFRHCSRAAADLVNAENFLYAALKFVPNALKSFMALQLTIRVTPQQLRRKLEQRFCDNCGKLAHYLYMPTLRPACLWCVHQAGSRYLGAPVPDWEMSSRYEIGPAERRCLPSFQFLPATSNKGVNHFRISRSHTLYDEDGPIDQRLRLHDEQIPAEVDHDTWNYWEGLMDRDNSLEEPDPSKPKRIALSDPALDMLRMHMCVLFVPSVDFSASQSEQDFFCTTFSYAKDGHMLYIKKEFLEHAVDCRVGPYDDDLVMDEQNLSLLQTDDCQAPMTSQ